MIEGAKITFTAHGDLQARVARRHEEIRRLIDNSAVEPDVEWSALICHAVGHIVFSQGIPDCDRNRDRILQMMMIKIIPSIMAEFGGDIPEGGDI
jgi:hypothetical protein